jgi:hypothetical protein
MLSQMVIQMGTFKLISRLILSILGLLANLEVHAFGGYRYSGNNQVAKFDYVQQHRVVRKLFLARFVARLYSAGAS